ncbi:MAG: sigma-70 family RNA polymerase sigma factor [Chitinophaga sp.]|nr:sigma-70 family RNA polymerase sigma factor [Chitinophaga sp.]
MKEPRTYITEQELINGLKQREQAAFSFLYDHYSSALNGVIYNIIPDTNIATDILQEVFVKIWRLIDSYDPDKGKLFTWMFNIARNTAIDLARSKEWRNSKRNNRLTDDYAQLPDRSLPPSDLPELRKIVYSLKDEYKTVIELSYFEGYTQKEIATMEQIPLGTVKTRLRAALLQLKKKINL